MGYYYWFRVFMMCLSLGAVIFIIRYLNPENSQNHTSSFLSWMGIESENVVNICPTRVTALMSHSSAVVEDQMKWYRRTGEVMQELDPVAVEKWFSGYCMVKAEPASKVDPMPITLTFKFVNGQTELLYQNSDGVFRWKDQYFRSAQLDEGIQALGTLPIHTRIHRGRNIETH